MSEATVRHELGCGCEGCRQVRVAPFVKDRSKAGHQTKKPKKKRPLERTLEWARKRGWPVDRTERYIPNAAGRPGGTRKDLFGFADAVALDGLPGLLALQACGTDVGPHARKLVELEHLKAWLAAGNRLWIVGWRELWVESANGKSKRRRWVPRVIQVVPSDIFESGYEVLEGEPSPIEVPDAAV